VVLRPDALEIAGESSDAWSGTILNRRFTGGSVVYLVRMSDGVILEVNSQKMNLREGDNASVIVKEESVPIVSGDDD
jgi:ABC-type Fe3+/spermidine/putrescine transport system ATPase subunit